jgi:DNA-binding FrmR family transcriptional regulator
MTAFPQDREPLHTPMGYVMQTDTKASAMKRLNRIEGQVRGITKMIDDRDGIDVITQISAVQAALRRVEEEILRDRVTHCVEHAIQSGDPESQREKIAELIVVLGRSGR